MLFCSDSRSCGPRRSPKAILKLQDSHLINSDTLEQAGFGNEMDRSVLLGVFGHRDVGNPFEGQKDAPEAAEV